VRVIEDNYGVAILNHSSVAPDSRFVVIPHECVWKRIHNLTDQNGGEKPEIWRNGQIIEIPRGSRSGKWRIFSTVDSARGVIIKLDRPDAIAFSDAKGATGVKVGLASLISQGALRPKRTLVGTPRK
jgi:hypothetical protein